MPADMRGYEEFYAQLTRNLVRIRAKQYASGRQFAMARKRPASTYQSYEARVRTIPVIELAEIADFLGVPVSAFFPGGNDEE